MNNHLIKSNARELINRIGLLADKDPNMNLVLALGKIKSAMKLYELYEQQVEEKKLEEVA